MSSPEKAHDQRKQKITRSSNAAEVKRILHWSDIQWSRFRVVTTTEYYKHTGSSPHSNNWRDVAANIKQDIIREAEKKLEAELIGENNSKDQLEKAIDWRMHQISKGKRTRRDSSPSHSDTNVGVKQDTKEDTKGDTKEDAQDTKVSKRKRDEKSTEVPGTGTKDAGEGRKRRKEKGKADGSARSAKSSNKRNMDRSKLSPQLSEDSQSLDEVLLGG